MVVYRLVGYNPQKARRLHRIDVGAQEERFPAIPAILALDHLFHLLSSEESVFWHIFRLGVLVNGLGDGI